MFAGRNHDAVGLIRSKQTLSASRFQLGQVQIGGYYVPTQELGIALFREFLLPFEITSVLVLIAIMGAVVLARKERP